MTKPKRKLRRALTYRSPKGIEYTEGQIRQRRAVFFEPVESKEELNYFLKAFFRIDLPDHILDEESNSTPLQLVWSVYDVMRTNQGPKRHVVAASRNTAKTLASAIIHFLAMIHFRRQCVHVASQKDQAAICLDYMSQFCKLPEVSEYFEVANVWERHLDGLPPNSFTSKPDASVCIATATTKGANAKRANLIIEDEVDLTPRKILAELAGMLDPTRDTNQFDPVVVALSSRKTNSGPLQDRIDEALSDAASGKEPQIQLHKFSVVDWMQPCANPGTPTEAMYIHQDNLSIVWSKKDYDILLETEKPKYKPYACYNNCRQCPVLIPCFGRCAKQVNTSPRLRKHEFISGLIREVNDTNVIIAQYLNWRPESTGNVFRTFNYGTHTGSPTRAWHFAFGTPYNKPEKLTTDKLARELVSNHWYILWGIDWGFSDAAACSVVAYHKEIKKYIVLQALTLREHSPQQFADRCVAEFGHRFPPYLICPDTEDPASHTYFKGYGLKTRRRKPKRIMTGVSQLRGLMWNPHSQSSNMVLVVDETDTHYEHMQELIRQITNWRHKTTPMGTPDLETFEDGNDHLIDTIRYPLDLFLIDNANIKVSAGANMEVVTTAQASGYEAHKTAIDAIHRTYSAHQDINLDKNVIASMLADAQLLSEPEAVRDGKKTSKIKFSF